MAQRYNELLLHKPNRTKMTSASVIMGTAELVSQQFCYPPSSTSSQEKATHKPRGDPTKLVVLEKGFNVGVFNIGHGIAFGVLHGACFNAPLLHNFFRLTAHWHLAARHC